MQSSLPGVPATASPSLQIQAHQSEVLSLDWNKYHSHLIATGSVDQSIKIHDLRMVTSQPPQLGSMIPTMQPIATVASLLGHEYAVRRVAWSPHSPNILASASYDMTSRLWEINSGNLGSPSAGGGVQFGPNGLGGGRLVRIHDSHTEFVVGVAFSLYEEGLVASCGWDQEVQIWR